MLYKKRDIKNHMWCFTKWALKTDKVIMLENY